MRTGALIVYTSADSVFQIAAHEEVVPVPELYRACEIAYELVGEGLGVGRVIARPFVGDARAVHADREPPRLRAAAVRRDAARSHDGRVACRWSRSARSRICSPAAASRAPCHTVSDDDGMDRVARADGQASTRGLIFANLVDFDTQYGHRNDVAGLRAEPRALRRPARRAAAAAAADRSAGRHRRSRQRSDDAEHRSLARVRAAAGRRARASAPASTSGTRRTFADLGQTLAELFGVGALAHGTSFLREITGVTDRVVDGCACDSRARV